MATPKFHSGDVVEVGPRYAGQGHYEHDGAEGLWYVLRPMADDQGDYLLSKSLVGQEREMICNESRMMAVGPTRSKVLSMRSSIAEVTDAQQFAYSWEYVKDFHFLPLFEGMTVKSVLELADALDQDAQRMHMDLTSTCPKARSIRWRVGEIERDGECCGLSLSTRLALRLAAARRVHCWCHETGSYALDSNYVRHWEFHRSMQCDSSVESGQH